MIEAVSGVFGVLAFFLLLKVVYRVIDVVIDAVSLLCAGCGGLYRGWKAQRAEEKENGAEEKENGAEEKENGSC